MYATRIMAQDIVSGIVVDGKNNPLPGARIEIVGTSDAVYTDVDGEFRFERPAAVQKVRVSYAGRKPVTLSITPQMIVKLSNGWAGKSKGFRGFFEMAGGFGIGGKVNAHAGSCEINDIASFLNTGISFSFGYQLSRHLYAGLGFGVYANMTTATYTDDFSIYDDAKSFAYARIPVFADVRWDFGLWSKASPYVGVKAGYQMSLCLDSYDYDYHRSIASTYDYYQQNTPKLIVMADRVNGLYISPYFGIRTNLYGKCGINLGLSYEISQPKKLHAIYEYGHYENRTKEHMNLGKSYSGVLMFNIGFDF